MRIRPVIAVIVLLLASCGGAGESMVAQVGDASTAAPTTTVAVSATAPSTVPPPSPVADTPTTGPSTSQPSASQPSTSQPATSQLAASIVEIDDALYEAPPEPLPAPVAITVESIGVDEAPIVPVGALPDGALEIPGAAEVGWYRFGPRPGDAGSSVLAAHIAFDGEPGVFLDLDQVDVGDAVSVTFEEGGARRFEVTDTVRYTKDSLPVDRIFARAGASGLVLITCGGAFDPELRSYEDNVVVYTVPVD